MISRPQVTTNGDERMSTDPLLINDETSLHLLRNSESKRQEPRVDRIEVFQTVWWRVVHAFAFVLGGATFVAGSACYFVPSWADASVFAGVTYTIGSLGFLTVDLLEFFTFTRPRLLRLNIAASAIGSLCYVIGSLFFVPVLAAVKLSARSSATGASFWARGSSDVRKCSKWRALCAIAPCVELGSRHSGWRRGRRGRGRVVLFRWHAVVQL
jgi:hypothetical protein